MNKNSSPATNNSLDGKVALVTGGASGIGAAISTLFASQGAAVAVVDVDRDRETRLVASLKDKGYKALGLYADVSVSSDCDAAVHDCVHAFGDIDVLCNNAGIIQRASIVDTSEEEWDRLMAVNVKGMFLMSQRVVPLMAASGGGSIVNMGSGWGLSGGPRAAAYCASKGAVVQLTKAMAIDHGPQEIRVNCICPGDVETRMLETEAEQLGVEMVSLLWEARERPLQRAGLPEEVAQAALFLSCNTSSYITGTTLVVDGGGLAG